MRAAPGKRTQILADLSSLTEIALSKSFQPMQFTVEAKCESEG